MGLAHDDGWAIPADRPFYPPLPAYYRNVRLHSVLFRASPSAVKELLPEPLEPADDGLCVACGLAIPFCSHYGPFQEALVQQKCLFRGQVGWFCSHVLHDGPAGIAAGREIYGTPKIYARLNVQQADRVMSTTAELAGVRVVCIASTMESRIEPADVPVFSPSWRLKIIPRADGPGPAIKQLIDGAAAAQDVCVHACFQGRGTVQFERNPLCDLAGLAPLECLDAWYLEMSYAEGFAKIAYDYLARL